MTNDELRIQVQKDLQKAADLMTEAGEITRQASDILGTMTCADVDSPVEPPVEPPGKMIMLPLGYGADSDFGSNGKVIEVTNLQDSGTGSFRHALESKGARKVVFKVSGCAPCTTRIELGEGNLSILGSTAPGKGFRIQATPENNDKILRIMKPDVLIENVGFFQSNPPAGSNVNNRDTIGLYNDARRVVFSQCTFAWGADETVQVYSSRPNGYSDITFQYCLFAEALSNVGHASGEHSKGMLLGHYSSKISIHHNWFVKNKDRNPQLFCDLGQLVNNIIIAGGEGYRPMSIGNIKSSVTQRYDVIANRIYGKPGVESGCFIPLPDPAPNNIPSMPVYAKGNIGGYRFDDGLPENAFFSQWGKHIALSLQSTPQTAPIVQTHTDVTTHGLRDYVKARVGACSWNRPDVEKRFLAIAPDYTTFADRAEEGTLYK